VIENKQTGIVFLMTCGLIQKGDYPDRWQTENWLCENNITSQRSYAYDLILCSEQSKFGLARHQCITKKRTFYMKKHHICFAHRATELYCWRQTISIEKSTVRKKLVAQINTRTVIHWMKKTITMDQSC